MPKVFRTLVAVAVTWVVSTAPPAAAQSDGGDAAARATRVAAVAGLGGIAKAGRWLPVWVDIDHTGDSPVRARVRVSWGTAVVERDLELGSSGRRELEMYIRSADVETAVAVRLETDRGRVDVEAPVTILPVGEPVTLCIVQQGAPASTSQCSITATADRLPRSPRGYDAINAIAWPAGPAMLAAPQREAVAQWQALRALEDAGDLGLTPQPTRPVLRRGLPAATGTTMFAGSVMYVGMLVLLAIAAVQRRLTLGRLAACAAAAIVAAAGGALLLGTMGPASGVRVHHATLLQQIPGTTASLMTTRAIAEFPSPGAFQVGLPVADSMIAVSARDGTSAQYFDVSGYPALRGTFGLGARQAFAAESLTNVQPIAVAISGGQARLTNVSRWPLRDCRFAADVFSPAAAGMLEPGASISRVLTGDILGPLATCTMDAPAVPFAAADRETITTGITTVAVYLPREPEWAVAELAND
jgi:hypothetical protein